MSASNSPRPRTTASRRDFLKTSSLAAGAAVVGGLDIARSAHAAGSDGFKIGLIGCGGRGSGAAVNAMNAGTDIKLVAMADIFDDRLQGARQRLKKIKPDQVAVRRRPLLRRLRRLPEGAEERHRRGADRLHLAFPPGLFQGRRRRRQAHLLREAARAGRARAEDGHGRQRRGQEEGPGRALRSLLAVRHRRARGDEARAGRPDRRHHRHRGKVRAPRPTACASASPSGTK